MKNKNKKKEIKKKEKKNRKEKNCKKDCVYKMRKTCRSSRKNQNVKKLKWKNRQFNGEKELKNREELNNWKLKNKDYYRKQN